MKTYVGITRNGKILTDTLDAAKRASCLYVDTLESYCNGNDERMAIYYLYMQANQTKRIWRGLRWVKRVGDEYVLSNKTIVGARSLPLFAAGFEPDSIEALMLREGMNRREKELYRYVRGNAEGIAEESLKSAEEALKSAEDR